MGVWQVAGQQAHCTLPEPIGAAERVVSEFLGPQRGGQIRVSKLFQFLGV